MFKYLIAFTMLAMLSGCAGALPWNKQNYAGINSVHFEWCENGEKQLPCNVEIVNGKEYGAIEFKFQMPDGSILNFAADDVRAFEGQALRAEVEKIVTEAVGRAAPEVVDKLISALVRP